MRRFRITQSDDNDRGATVIEYIILVAGTFTMVSGAADLAAGGMNKAFNDADAGVANVVADAPPDDGPGDGDEIPDAPGTGTIGYWKNHPEAWPIDELIIGEVMYDKAGLLAVLDMDGNKPAMLASQLIGATLNVSAGNADSCIAYTIAQADTWLGTYPIGASGAAVNSAWGESGDAWKTELDEYNNGLLCAAHRG